VYTIPIIFNEIVHELSYINNGRSVGLSNIIFFLGAGFSKSWDHRYPLAKDLFKFDDLQFHPKCETLGEFIFQCGYDSNGQINMDEFSECYYRLEMLKKYPELRPRYIDEQTLKIIENEFRFVVWEVLNKKVKINYLRNDHICFDKKNKNQIEIINFFIGLFQQIDGSYGIPVGIRTNFITTNYDFIIEGITDEYYAIYEDYQTLHNYRGFTPLKVDGTNNIKPLHFHLLVNNLFKINGGIEIFKEGDSFNLDYRRRKIKDVLVNPPEIILPSKEQNYSSKYFKSIFSKATRLLQESSVLVIIGYSFPKEDALIRFMLRHFAEDDRDIANKYIFYIDIGDKTKLLNKICSIFPVNNGYKSRVFVYNKGFIRFAKLTNKIGWP
jgi:hypothetical protein